MLDFGRFANEVSTIYDQHIIDTGKQAQALILVSFLATFVAVRAITHTIRAGRWPWLFRNVVTPGGTHFHHLVPGILLLLTVGYLGIGLDPAGYRGLLAVLFGVGAALTLDEFALWLRLQDVYWAKQGRTSIDAVVIAATLIALGILGWSFWLDLGHAVGRLVGIV